jgi:hypothetical protein
MAENLGIPAVTYRSYESGRSEPPMGLLGRLLGSGVDAQYVAIGRSASELLGEELDWMLLVEICRVLGEWSSSRPRPLDLDEMSRFLRTAYMWAARNGRQAGLELVAELCRAA